MLVGLAAGPSRQQARLRPGRHLHPLIGLQGDCAYAETMDQSDWSAVRARFPVLKEWTHLNTAAFGPTPTEAVRAMTDYCAARDAGASLDFLDWFDRLDRLRGKIGLLIGAESADIAFCPSAAAALSWLLRGIDWRSGDEILALDHEFPSNLYAPLLLDAKGVDFRALPAPTGLFEPELVLDAVGPRTRLVVVSEVNYSNGLRAPLDALSPELRKRGVLLCVDATQSVGVLRHDLRKVPVDYLFAHGYKWLMAPPGAGFAYVPEWTRDWLRPSIVSWRTHRTWRDHEHLHHGRPELPAEAAMYEGGVQPFALLFALEACVDLILECGQPQIESRVLGFARTCLEILQSRGGEPLIPSIEDCNSPIIAASFPGRDAVRLRETLERARVAVSVRKGNLRVSPHFFNNVEDLRRLAAALDN